MSYWKKCLSTGDYQYIATGDPAPGDIVVQWWEVELAQKDQRIVALKEELDGMLSVNDNANRCIAELIEVLSDIVLGTPIDDCNRDDDGLNAHPRNMERRIERAKSILKKEGGKW